MTGATGSLAPPMRRPVLVLWGSAAGELPGSTVRGRRLYEAHHSAAGGDQIRLVDAALATAR